MLPKDELDIVVAWREVRHAERRAVGRIGCVVNGVALRGRDRLISRADRSAARESRLAR